VGKGGEEKGRAYDTKAVESGRGEGRGRRQVTASESPKTARGLRISGVYWGQSWGKKEPRPEVVST